MKADETKTLTLEHWEFLCQSATAEAFAPFYEASRGLVWTICRRVLRSDDDAMDAFQATYTRLLLQARDPASRQLPEHPREWVMRLAGREADNLRKRRACRARKEVAMDGLDDFFASGEHSPAQEAQRRQVREKIELLIETLPDRYRTPLALYCLHGLTRREIAHTLGRKQGTVSLQIWRGLHLLKPMLRRAGLAPELTAGLKTGLAAVVAGIWLEPPAVTASLLIFTNAHTALTAGGATALALGKISLGMTLLKSKVALSSGLLVLFAGGAAIWHIHGSGTRNAMEQAGSAVAVKTNVPPQVQSPVPSPAPSGIATPVAQTTPAMPNITNPTSPAAPPSPSGPRRGITVAVNWEDSQQGIAGVRVTIGETSPSARTRRAEGDTDAKGFATLSVPQSWLRSLISVSNTEIVRQSKTVEMPPPEIVPFFVARGAAVFGVVKKKEGGDPMGKATVMMRHSRGTTYTQQLETDSTGRFEFSGIAPGAVRLVAALDGLRSDLDGPKAVGLQGGDRKGPLDLLLAQGQELVGRVTDVESGNALAGARVFGDNMEEVETDASGTYRLPVKEGRNNITASRDHYANGFGIATISGPQQQTLDFKLEPAPVTTIKVLDDKGAPIAGANINAELQPGYGSRLGYTDAQGIFVTSRLGRRNFSSLSPEKQGYLPPIGNPQLTFHAADGTAEVTFTLKEVTAKKTVAGLVTSADGKPLVGARVQWGATMGRIKGLSRAMTDANGHYELTFVYESDAINLAATAKGWAPQIRAKVPVKSDTEPTIVDFTLQPGHWLAGTVVSESGDPVPSAAVTVRAPEDEHFMYADIFARTTTDEQGRFRVENVSDAPALVLVDKQGWIDLEQESEVDRDIRLTLKQPGVVLGRVVDRESRQPVPMFTVKMRSPGYDTRMFEPGLTYRDPDGNFLMKEITPSPSGVDLRIEAAGYASRTVTNIPVQSGAEPKPFEIEITKGAPFDGMLVDAARSQPIAGAHIAIMRAESLGRLTGIVNWDRIMMTEEIARSQAGAGLNSLPDFQSTVSATDGAFHFDREDGTTLFIRAAGYEDLRIDPAQRAQYQQAPPQLRIALHPGLTLKGTVLPIGDATGQTMIQIYPVQLARGANGRLEAQRTATTDAAQAFQFDSLSPGSYELSVQRWLPANRAQSWQNIYQRIDVRAEAENTARFGENLGPLSLTGRILDAAGNPPIQNIASVKLLPRFAWQYTEFSRDVMGKGAGDNAGKFVFWGLQPGTYELVVQCTFGGPTQSLGMFELTGNMTRDFRTPN